MRQWCLPSLLCVNLGSIYAAELILLLHRIQIHKTLSSWKTGVLEQKGQKLAAAVYSQFYQGHVGWIRKWKDIPMRAEEWKNISLDLGKEATCVFHYQHNSVNIPANFGD